MNFDGNWSELQPAEALELSRRYIFTKDLLPLFLKYTGAQNAKIMVDIGCGTGTFSRYLAKGMKTDSRIIGLDLDKTLLDYAEKKAEDEGLSDKISFKVANAYELPFNDESIDAITDHTLLINLEDPDKCIREELRVLKSGGTISTATFIWGYFPPQRLVKSDEYCLLDKTQAKMYKIYKDYLFPQVPIGANDYNVYSIMERYSRLGVKNVQINGFFPIFSPDDSRYIGERQQWLTDMYMFQRSEMEKFLNNIDSYKEYGLTKEELEIAIELLEKRYKFDLNNRIWIFNNGIEMVIYGNK